MFKPPHAQKSQDLHILGLLRMIILQPIGKSGVAS